MKNQVINAGRWIKLYKACIKMKKKVKIFGRFDQKVN